MALPDGFSLVGKCALITGDGRGWTPVLAAALAAAGADVAVAALDKPERVATVKAVEAFGRKALDLPTDVSKELDVRRAIRQFLNDFPQLDILVNNAHVEFFKPTAEVTNREIVQVLDINTKGTFLCCREAGKVMVQQKSGRIVNIVSGLAERGVMNGALYCASQASVLGMTRALGIEWARSNVRVNALGAGWYSLDRPKGGEASDRDLLNRYIPLHRKGHPDDLAAALVFLCSDAADYMAGATIYVDGGLMAHA